MKGLTVFIAIMCLLTFFCLIFFIGIYLKYNPYATEIEEHIIGDGKQLKVGVMGDSHLLADGSELDLIYIEHLKKSFETMKAENVQVLVYTGDLTHSGNKKGYDIFKKIFDNVFEETQKPILNIIMGNHEYWSPLTIPTFTQKNFYDSIGEKPFSHKVINGFHFINWSNLDGTILTCNANLLWAKNEIEKARKNNKEKGNEYYPIFVITHMPPHDTVYKSERWGNIMIRELLNNYKEVISVSGHSHYPLLDERSIWQEEFTAVTAQSTSYIEIEEGKENGSTEDDDRQKQKNENYMGYIMDINESQIIFKRIALKSGEYYNKHWVIPFPITHETEFTYTRELQMKMSKTPVFKENSTIEYIFDNNSHEIIFDQPVLEDNSSVHSYEITIENVTKKKKSKVYEYFSDFFLFPSNRAERLKLRLPKFVKKGNEYKITVVAVGYFNKKSEGLELNFIAGEN